jgi:thiamine-phosphate pyrophosphorylase
MILASTLRLMVVTDPAVLKGRDVVGECRAAVRGGATVVQLRDKEASPRDLVALAHALVVALAVPVLVNDRVDVALAAGAAGAHLGQDDLPLDAARRHTPPGFLLGTSVGSEAEAVRAAAWPADYWSIGPCFRTPHKADAGPPLGPTGFARLAALAPAGVPVIGIGGIDAENAAALAAAGARGVAVIGAAFGSGDPEAAVRRLARSMADDGRGRG